MFGTIGHFQVKAGHEDHIRELLAEWERTMRPTIPGLVIQLQGRPVDRSGEIIAVVLMQDEDTYRGLAANPGQDAWYRQMLEHLEAEPSWDDIAWDTARLDVGQAGQR